MPLHNPPTPNAESSDLWNLATLAHEVGSIDKRLSNLEENSETTNNLLEQLVTIQTRRDTREEQELVIERERRKASAEAELIRVQAGITERSARGAWFRSLVSKDMLMPIVGAIVGILSAWAAGIGMGPSQGITVNQPLGQPATTFVTGASGPEPGSVITVPTEPAPAAAPAPVQ